MSTILQDLRYGSRMLRKNLGFTIVALIALILGIASTTAIFSVVDGVLLHPLPYPDSEHILSVSQTVRSTGLSTQDSSPANYLDWLSQNNVFLHMAASRGGQGNLTEGDRPERVRMTVTTASFFPLFGVNPILGRTLLPTDAHNAKLEIPAPTVQTLGIPLRRGRDFDARDISGAPEVAVINEALARRYFPDEDALGKRIRVGDQPWHTIVGIVGNRRSGLDVEATPEMYYPMLQDPVPFMALVLRTTRDPRALAADVRNVVRAVDPDQPVFDIKTMEEVVDGSVSSRRLTMVLLSTFATLAIVLAAIGIYGVISYMVAQRTHEIGVRMALGAQRHDVLRLILGHGMVLATIGIGLGVTASLALTRVLSTLLFGVSSTDPSTFLAVSLLLATVALIAGYIPGRRATKVDPIIALREG